jgi:ribosomal protein L15
MKLEKLTAKINPHEIQWRIQSAKNGKTTVVPYLTNRCVMERFDEEFGAMHWKNEFVEWRGKGVKCGISARNEQSGEWVTKYDGADETNIESTKGGFSDSMKRAAVQWGLGRDLYEYPMIQIEGEIRFLSREHERELNKIAQRILGGENVGDYVKIGSGATQTQQPVKQAPKPTPKAERVIVAEGDENFLKIVKGVSTGKATLQQALDKFNISEAVEASLKEKIQSLAEIV